MRTDTREALYWEKAEDSKVRCELCPHRCLIPENSAGLCGARQNRGGVLAASGYGRVSSAALDPVEKKPLYMFHPGKRVLSIGGFGCNMKCPFCQNHEISMFRGSFSSENTDGRPPRSMSPDDVVKLARQTVPEGNIGIAYTYNEPFIGYEFLRDCASLIRDAGLQNVIVTNGFINKKPLEEILPFIDAMNIDLKAFTEGFYKKIGGSLSAVKETIASSYGRCHVEVTTLVIPGENEDDIPELSKWLASVGRDIPLHLTRFFPRYRYTDKTPTSRDVIYRSRNAAKENLKYVFTGNM